MCLLVYVFTSLLHCRLVVVTWSKSMPKPTAGVRDGSADILETRPTHYGKKKDSSNTLSDLPGVEAINITNGQVLQTSYRTISQMKVYKGLEG